MSTESRDELTVLDGILHALPPSSYVASDESVTQARNAVGRGTYDMAQKILGCRRAILLGTWLSRSQICGSALTRDPRRFMSTTDENWPYAGVLIGAYRDHTLRQIYKEKSIQ